MILKNIVTAVFCVDTFGLILAASYSNVYFQLGSNGLVQVPVDVAAFPSSQVQQAPLIPLLPISTLIAPCTVPCINPYQPVSNSKLIANKPASKPLDDDSSKYGYSYVIFDDGTGDKKAQYEVSDGGKVRGQFSLLQSDGNVREVQYTSDDLKGFKTAITNLLRGKVIFSAEENNKTEDSAPVALKEERTEILAPENESKSVSSGQTPNDKPLEDSSSNNTLGKEEQTAEVKEIKPLQSGPTQETSVNAAVEEIKPKPNEATNDALTESNSFNAYGNIIKCIQTSMKNSESPLVYIILPSKPCS